MLTEKRKEFIERMAKKIQFNFNRLKEPNRYDYNEIIQWLKASGASIEKGSTNHTKGLTIYLDFYQRSNLDEIIGNDPQKIKVLFHEMWHFISNKIDSMQDVEEIDKIPITDFDNGFEEKSILPIEICANYFSRAMMFPEKAFIEVIMKNIDINGSCNIYAVAEEFSCSYIDVIARGNDLNLWSQR